MRRWGISLVLLLSLGVNLGLLGAIAAGRWAERERPADEPPLALPDGGRELPSGLTVDLPTAAEAGEPVEPGIEAEPMPAAGEAGAGDDPAPAGAGTVGPPAGGAATRSADAPDGAETAPSTSAAIGEGEAGLRGPEGFGPRPLRDRGGRRGFAGRGGERMAGEPPVGRLADHLGLEGDRRERFVALQRRFLAVHLEGRRERARLAGELRGELVADAPDRVRIEALVGRLAEVYAASERATAEVVLESRELLDADQQERYFRFLERLREGPPPGGGPGPGAGRHRRPQP